jgi:hypothetical protein
MNYKGICLKLSRLLTALLLVQMALAGGLGCNRTPATPGPLALEQIPAELQKVFVNPSPEQKGLITELTENLQSKDFSAAFRTLQSFIQLRGLNKDQHLALARSQLTLTALLQSAQSQGDQKANTALKEYYMSK